MTVPVATGDLIPSLPQDRVDFHSRRTELYFHGGMPLEFAEKLAYSDLLALLGRFGTEAQSRQLHSEELIAASVELLVETFL